MTQNKIISYCHIKNNSVFVNGKLVYESKDALDLSGFLSELYKGIPLNYPKFFKMDNQCKLGILATEFLIKEIPGFESMNKQDLGLVFSNKASSLESDRKHIASISDKGNYFPSPAVFVYTLANIVIGEIAIKHKISGENAFFVSENFDAELLCNYSNILLGNNESSALLCGWVNVDGKSAEAFVYCVKNLTFKDAESTAGIEHNTERIQQLYAN